METASEENTSTDDRINHDSTRTLCPRLSAAVISPVNAWSMKYVSTRVKTRKSICMAKVRGLYPPEFESDEIISAAASGRGADVAGTTGRPVAAKLRKEPSQLGQAPSQ